MKRSVGLVVMVRIPDQGTPIGHRVMACLQRRGTFNHEKMAPESFPGCLQVTCHGGLNDGEDFMGGLLREMQEELGERFVVTYAHGYLAILTETMTAEKQVVTYGTLVPIDSICDLVRLGPDSGGLVYVGAEQVENIVKIIPDMKESGPPPYLMAMFPDEIEAVKKAFEIFGKM